MRESIRPSMRVFISSLIGRFASTPWPAGSSRTQSSYRLPGKYGHSSPQPMVMTTSDSLTASVVSTFGISADMSMPSSAMASTAAGLTLSAGWEPAERTSISPLARVVRNAAAIWDRPALWTQTNRTEGFLLVSVVMLLLQGWGSDHRGSEIALARPEGYIHKCNKYGY